MNTVIQRAERADSLGMAECPEAKMCGNLWTFDLSVKIMHALLTVSMPDILLVR